MNKYLSESDSDLDDYQSVSSEQIPNYNNKYRKIMNLEKKWKTKQKEWQDKKNKLHRILNNTSFDKNEMQNVSNWNSNSVIMSRSDVDFNRKGRAIFMNIKP